MRVVAVVVVVAALAAGGLFLYRRFNPTSAACARVADRCGLDRDAAESCERAVGEVRKAAGGEAAGKLVSCLSEAQSCATAAGCAAGVGGALFSRSMLEFLDGLRRSR